MRHCEDGFDLRAGGGVGGAVDAGKVVARSRSTDLSPACLQLPRTDGECWMRRRRWTSGLLSLALSVLIAWPAGAQTSDPFQSAPGPAPAAPAPAPPQRAKPQTTTAAPRPARPRPPPAPEPPARPVV